MPTSDIMEPLERWGGCLSSLQPAERRVMRLRAGTRATGGRARSESRVAAMLGVSLDRVRTLEHRAIRGLGLAARTSACGGSVDYVPGSLGSPGLAQFAPGAQGSAGDASIVPAPLRKVSNAVGARARSVGRALGAFARNAPPAVERFGRSAAAHWDNPVVVVLLCIVLMAVAGLALEARRLVR